MLWARTTLFKAQMPPCGRQRFPGNHPRAVVLRAPRPTRLAARPRRPLGSPGRCGLGLLEGEALVYALQLPLSAARETVNACSEWGRPARGLVLGAADTVRGSRARLRPQCGPPCPRLSSRRRPLCSGHLACPSPHGHCARLRCDRPWEAVLSAARGPRPRCGRAEPGLAGHDSHLRAAGPRRFSGRCPCGRPPSGLLVPPGRC